MTTGPEFLSLAEEYASRAQNTSQDVHRQQRDATLALAYAQMATAAATAYPIFEGRLDGGERLTIHKEWIEALEHIDG